MESSVVSTISDGDRTLTLNTGYFGYRMLMINQVHGAKANVIAYPDGVHANPDDLRNRFRKAKYKAVFITHVDTSNSVDARFDASCWNWEWQNPSCLQDRSKTGGTEPIRDKA